MPTAGWSTRRTRRMARSLRSARRWARRCGVRPGPTTRPVGWRASRIPTRSDSTSRAVELPRLRHGRQPRRRRRAGPAPDRRRRPQLPVRRRAVLTVAQPLLPTSPPLRPRHRPVHAGGHLSRPRPRAADAPSVRVRAREPDHRSRPERDDDAERNQRSRTHDW